jgi:hypothetical protein
VRYVVFIGLLLLFGVTNKNHMSVNEIWAVGKLHHSDHATSFMKRERFKEIAALITFDDVDTRHLR